MSEDASGEDKALAAQGATKEDLDAGASNNKDGIPKAPSEPSNEPPKPSKEELSEEHGEPKAKVQEDPAEAAKKKVETDRAELEANGPLREYIQSTDPNVAAAIDLLKEAGVGPNEADKFFAKALKSGDVNDIDVAGLEFRLGKAKTTLLMAGVRSHYAGLTERTNATVKQTYDIYGGQENWETVRAWAQTAEKADKVTAQKVASIRDMLNAGGVQAEAGARELLRMYNAAPDTKGLGTNKLVVGDSTGKVIGQPLNRADYLSELKKAHERGAKPAEIAAIDARRRAGRAAGL